MSRRCVENVRSSEKHLKAFGKHPRKCIKTYQQPESVLIVKLRSFLCISSLFFDIFQMLFGLPEVLYTLSRHSSFIEMDWTRIVVGQESFSQVEDQFYKN